MQANRSSRITHTAWLTLTLPLDSGKNTKAMVQMVNAFGNNFHKRIEVRLHPACMAAAIPLPSESAFRFGA